MEVQQKPILVRDHEPIWPQREVMVFIIHLSRITIPDNDMLSSMLACNNGNCKAVPDNIFLLSSRFSSQDPVGVEKKANQVLRLEWLRCSPVPERALSTQAPQTMEEVISRSLEEVALSSTVIARLIIKRFSSGAAGLSGAPFRF